MHLFQYEDDYEKITRKELETYAKELTGEVKELVNRNAANYNKLDKARRENEKLLTIIDNLAAAIRKL